MNTYNCYLFVYIVQLFVYIRYLFEYIVQLFVYICYLFEYIVQMSALIRGYSIFKSNSVSLFDKGRAPHYFCYQSEQSCVLLR
jgi:hypothetical protein